MLEPWWHLSASHSADLNKQRRYCITAAYRPGVCGCDSGPSVWLPVICTAAGGLPATSELLFVVNCRNSAKFWSSNLISYVWRLMYCIFAKMVDSERGLISLVVSKTGRKAYITYLKKKTKTIQEFQLDRWMVVLENLSFCPNKQRLTISLIILSLHFALNFGMWGSTVIIGIWQPTEISGPRSSGLAAAAWTGSLTFPHSWMSEWWCHTSCSHRAGWLIQLTTAWLSAATWVFTSLFSYFFQSWLRFQGFAGLSGPSHQSSGVRLCNLLRDEPASRGLRRLNVL